MASASHEPIMLAGKCRNGFSYALRRGPNGNPYLVNRRHPGSAYSLAAFLAAAHIPAVLKVQARTFADPAHEARAVLERVEVK